MILVLILEARCHPSVLLPIVIVVVPVAVAVAVAVIDVLQDIAIVLYF